MAEVEGRVVGAHLPHPGDPVAVAGQGVVWYTGQFYALSFLQTTLQVDLQKASMIIAVANWVQ